jgi:hypothetical protein
MKGKAMTKTTGPCYVGTDPDWPEAYSSIFARDEHGREIEFAGKIIWPELAELIARLLNETGAEPEFPALEQ